MVTLGKLTLFWAEIFIWGTNGPWGCLWEMHNHLPLTASEYTYSDFLGTIPGGGVILLFEGSLTFPTQEHLNVKIHPEHYFGVWRPS